MNISNNNTPSENISALLSYDGLPFNDLLNSCSGAMYNAVPTPPVILVIDIALWALFADEDEVAPRSPLMSSIASCDVSSSNSPCGLDEGRFDVARPKSPSRIFSSSSMKILSPICSVGW